MSLIVARQAGPHIVRVGDTHLTDPLGSERASALQGIIKIRILSDTLCVSFAGSLYWAEVGFAELENLGAVTIEAVTDILVKVHQDSSRSADFLVATTMPSLELLQVKDGQVRPVSVSWLVLQRDFTRPTKLGDSSLPMRDIRRLVALLPVADQVQCHPGIKVPLGQDPQQQHLHLGQGQARRFFLT